MSAKQTVMIACRALAVYCLVWFLADFAYLPLNVYTLYHHVETVSAMAAILTKLLPSGTVSSVAPHDWPLLRRAMVLPRGPVDRKVFLVSFR